MSHREARIYWYYTIVLFGIMLLWFIKELTDALITGVYRPSVGKAEVRKESILTASMPSNEHAPAYCSLFTSI